MVVGLAGALARSRAPASLVFGVEVREPTTFGAVAGISRPSRSRHVS